MLVESHDVGSHKQRGPQRYYQSRFFEIYRNALALLDPSDIESYINK